MFCAMINASDPTFHLFCEFKYPPSCFCVCWKMKMQIRSMKQVNFVNSSIHYSGLKYPPSCFSVYLENKKPAYIIQNFQLWPLVLYTWSCCVLDSWYWLLVPNLVYLDKILVVNYSITHPEWDSANLVRTVSFSRPLIGQVLPKKLSRWLNLTSSSFSLS